MRGELGIIESTAANDSKDEGMVAPVSLGRSPHVG